MKKLFLFLPFPLTVLIIKFTDVMVRVSAFALCFVFCAGLLSACGNATLCDKLANQREAIVNDLFVSTSLEQRQSLTMALSRTDSTIISVCNCK